MCKVDSRSTLIDDFVSCAAIIVPLAPTLYFLRAKVSTGINRRVNFHRVANHLAIAASGLRGVENRSSVTFVPLLRDA